MCPTGWYDYSSYNMHNYFKILSESRSCALIFEINHVRGEYFSPNSSSVLAELPWQEGSNHSTKKICQGSSEQTDEKWKTSNIFNYQLSYCTSTIIFSTEKLTNNCSELYKSYKYSLDLIHHFRLNITYKWQTK